MARLRAPSVDCVARQISANKYFMLLQSYCYCHCQEKEKMLIR